MLEMWRTPWISTQRGQFFQHKMLHSSSGEFGQGNSLECCLQVWHGKEGICISFTISKNYIQGLERGHFLATDKRARAQAPFDVYVCTCLLWKERKVRH